jgi:hypothetical protein
MEVNMDTSREDFIRERKKALRQADRQLIEAMQAAKKRGKEVASHDKALQDAKDLSHLAHRELRALDDGEDITFAQDRSGLEVTMSKLQQALASVKTS